MLVNKQLTIQIQENVPLAPLTTLGVGGPARYFTVITAPDQVIAAITWARARSLPLFVLGGGSNLVVADAGFPGLVLKMATRGITPLSRGRVEAAAGVPWDDFVNFCVERNLAGVEALSGIPGVTGGAPIQNIGAYGQEAGDVIELVRAWDMVEDREVALDRDACSFAYRRSVFNSSGTGRYVVRSVVFALAPAGAPTIRHADLDKWFAGRARPTLASVREAVLATRRAKSMLVNPYDPNNPDGPNNSNVPDDPDARSAGSFFHNPELDAAQFAALEQTARARGLVTAKENVPGFTTPTGQIKVPAAWLIERSGIEKGYALGRAGVSSKHTLALINRGGATAAEILALMRLIQSRVKATLQINLEPEPVFLGFSDT